MRYTKYKTRCKVVLTGDDDVYLKTSPALAPVHRWIGLLRREYSEAPWGLEPHSHPLTKGNKGCGACQATLLWWALRAVVGAAVVVRSRRGSTGGDHVELGVVPAR